MLGEARYVAGKPGALWLCRARGAIRPFPGARITRRHARLIRIEPGLLLRGVALERTEELIPCEIGLAPQRLGLFQPRGAAGRELALELVQLAADFEQLALKRLPLGRFPRVRFIGRPYPAMALTSLRIRIDQNMARLVRTL